MATPRRGLAICGLAGNFSAIDVFVALKTGQSHLTEPNTLLLMTCSRVLLMVALISMYSPRGRAASIALAVGTLTLATWGTLIK
jgi:hypothetical protein